MDISAKIVSVHVCRLESIHKSQILQVQSACLHSGVRCAPTVARLKKNLKTLSTASTVSSRCRFGLRRLQCTLFCTQNQQERDTASISVLSCHPRTFFLFLMSCSIGNTFTQAALHCFPSREAAVLGNVRELVNTGSCVALILCTHMNAAPSFVGHSEYFGSSRGVSVAISSHVAETLKRKELIHWVEFF